MAHVKKHLQVGVWKIIEEFSLASATGKYRLQAINTSLKSPTIIQSPIHLSNLTIIFFLSLTPFETIISGNVIGEAIDIGDLQVVQAFGKFQISNAFEIIQYDHKPQGSDVKEFLKL
ncbi:hypothetical protein Bca4012_032691 [Brassica carinata]